MLPVSTTHTQKHSPVAGKRRLKHLHAWSKDRPVLVAMLVEQVVVTAPMLIQLMQWIREGWAARKLREHSDLANWLSLYRDPAGIRRIIDDCIPGGQTGTTAKALDMVQGRPPYACSRMTQMLDALPIELSFELQNMVDQMLMQLYIEQHAHLCLVLDNDEALMPPNMDELVCTANWQFGILVMLPAILEYGRSATHIYAQARRGDRIALNDLLRLDKSVMSDPKIGKYIQQMGMERDTMAGLIAQSYMNGPDGHLSPGNLKARLTAALVQLSDAMHFDLGPADIKRAFDAVHKDRTAERELIDVDLPESEEAWRQAVHRAKPFWGKRLHRDMELISPRHADLLLNAVVSDFDESAPRPTWIDHWNPQRRKPYRGFFARLRDWFK